MAQSPKKPSQKQHEAMGLYANILEEAKFRIRCVEDVLNGKITLPSPILHDLCFLQLRFICELIALGCLVIHGDIKGERAKKAARDGELRKKWSADEIIERLSDLHPGFYPIPHSQTRTKIGFHLEGVSDGYLTKDDLLKLYHLCGRHLHRGSLKKLLKSPQPMQFNFPDVLAWLKKIGTLLSFHMIPLFEEGTLVLVVLRNADDNERVQVAFAAKNIDEGDNVPVVKSRDRFDD